MKEVIEQIARLLVDQPDKVQVVEVQGEQSSVFELRVATEDLGKVIGKHGNNANAIRTLLKAAGMKVKKRFMLEILE